MEDNEKKIAAEAEETENKPQLTTKQKVVKEIREWVVALLVAVIITFIMKSYIFMPIRVDGGSMNPTLVDGQRLGVTVYDVKIQNKIERGDVVICNYPGRTSKDPILGLFTIDTNFVKRVVGVPGDTVSRVYGVTLINGQPLDPRYYNPYTSKPNYEYVLGEDEYFVVGDNRYNSHDSRTWNGPGSEMHLTNDASGDVGPITSDMILGHARFVFWPLSETGSIENNTTYVDPKDR